MVMLRGYRSPLWLSASHNGNPVLVHRQRGTKVFFHQALQDRKLLAIPGIHYFDAHRLRAHCYRLRSSNCILALATSQALKEQEMQSKISHRMKNETPRMLRLMLKLRRKSLGVPLSQTRQMTLPKARSPAADKLETMTHGSQPQVNIFFQPGNLGALPALWLQAKLTISLTSIQDKFAKLFMTIAAELWLRGRIDTLEAVFQAAARNFTGRNISEVFMLADAACGDIGHP